LESLTPSPPAHVGANASKNPFLAGFGTTKRGQLQGQALGYIEMKSQCFAGRLVEAQRMIPKSVRGFGQDHAQDQN
jgi:hypothetical protein